ncbi:MAG TPA: GerMN domain-containing protein [Syntrophorhabdaceae bacterium]|nr:GerMN domain-containing protein [Syntrophorhabdaceae bacterium]
MPRVYFEEEEKKGKKKFIVIILICVLIIITTLIYYSYNKKKGIKIINETKGIKELSIIYPASQWRLTKKIIQIKDNTPDKVKTDMIIKLLKDEKAIPNNVILHDYAVDDNGIIYVNLSRHMVEETKEPLREIMSLYSIVNTLIANTQNAKAVQVLIDGQVLYTLNGITYIYMPLPYNNDLMEE